MRRRETRNEAAHAPVEPSSPTFRLPAITAALRRRSPPGPRRRAPTTRSGHRLQARSHRPRRCQPGRVELDDPLLAAPEHRGRQEDDRPLRGRDAREPRGGPPVPAQVYLADKCPADTLIGRARRTSTCCRTRRGHDQPGRIYNQELLGNEAGRLGIIVDAPVQDVPDCAVLRAQQRRLRARRRARRPAAHAARRRQHPDPPPEVHAVRHRQGPEVHARPDQLLAERVHRRGEAYDHPGSASGPSDSYTPTDCDKLPFAPTFSMSVGRQGHDR